MNSEPFYICVKDSSLGQFIPLVSLGIKSNNVHTGGGLNVPELLQNIEIKKFEEYTNNLKVFDNISSNNSFKKQENIPDITLNNSVNEETTAPLYEGLPVKVQQVLQKLTQNTNHEDIKGGARNQEDLASVIIRESLDSWDDDLRDSM